MQIDHSKLKPGYDVVIVGAGAAGCLLVGELDSNLSVLLIDYRAMPRKKACSGIIVNEAHELLESKSPPKEIFFEPKELDMVYWDWNNDLKKTTKKAFWNSDRKKLDQWLYARLGERESVSVLEKTKLLDFFPTVDKSFLVLVLEINGTVRTILAKYLVGCDGALSTVRTKISPHKIPYYVAIQENLPNVTLKDAYFIFDSEVTDFYGWVIPKGKLVEVGVAVSPHNSKQKFELFKKKVKERFGISGDGEIDSAIVLRPNSLNEITLGKDHILLCGEAAGLISPSSAEGISYALRSGKFCADALNKKFKNALPEYKENCKPLLERLSKKFAKSALIRDSQNRVKLFSES